MLVEIGAGWTKESKAGNPYISISIDMDKLNKILKLDQTKVYAMLMENQKRNTEKSPDYRLSVQVDKE